MDKLAPKVRAQDVNHLPLAGPRENSTCAHPLDGIWAQLVEALGQDFLTLWRVERESLSTEGTNIILTVGHDFQRARVLKAVQPVLATIASARIGEHATVAVRVAARSASPSARVADSPTPEKRSDREIGKDSRIAPTKNSDRTSAPESDPPAEHRQRRPSISFDEVVRGDCNGFAMDALKHVVKRIGAVSPLLIHGPTGAGKTKLLEALYGEARRAGVGRCLFMTAEQFTTNFLEALGSRGLASFRQKYREVDLLIIDDIQFFVGKKSTLNEVSHTVDTLIRRERQIVFSSDRPKQRLEGLGHDLVSRMASGLHCEVAPPNAEMRKKILSQEAQKRNVSLSDEMLSHLADGLEGDARLLVGAINRIEASSRFLGQNIDMVLAKETVRSLGSESRSVVRLPDIEGIVCELFGLPARSLQASSRGRERETVEPRMFAMWLARRLTRSGLAEIGTFFGSRSHSTVLSAKQKVDQWIEEKRDLQLEAGRFRVDEAIRHAESRLAIRSG